MRKFRFCAYVQLLALAQEIENLQLAHSISECVAFQHPTRDQDKEYLEIGIVSRLQL